MSLLLYIWTHLSIRCGLSWIQLGLCLGSVGTPPVGNRGVREVVGGRWDSAGTAQGIFWDPAGTMLWRTLSFTRSLAPCMQSSPVCKDSDTDKTITTGTCLGTCCGERCQLLPALLFACNPIQLLSGSRARPGLKASVCKSLQITPEFEQPLRANHCKSLQITANHGPRV